MEHLLYCLNIQSDNSKRMKPNAHRMSKHSHCGEQLSNGCETWRSLTPPDSPIPGPHLRASPAHGHKEASTQQIVLNSSYVWATSAELAMGRGGDDLNAVCLFTQWKIAEHVKRVDRHPSTRASMKNTTLHGNNKLQNGKYCNIQWCR